MLRVLVVDDDHLVRRGLIGMMPWEKYGFQVAGEAGSAKKALEFLSREQVDVLITDLAMPLMSGIQLMREVKRLYPHIHAVVLTFHQDFDLIQEALRLGAIDYITKIELENEQMEEVMLRIRERITEYSERHDGLPQQGIAESFKSVNLQSSDDLLACIRKALDFIQTKYESELSLNLVAKEVNMSRSYFARCIKDFTGRTFNEHLRDIRISQAKVMLEQTMKPVYWVASRSGYPNEKYFCKVFKAVTGELPSEYRKKRMSGRTL
ncbi:response regulator transcription factor [Paenibacillus chungangensis]|uniref:Response regulator n=1 Tax=Paenibacillus chungangensis TaxID=696535 RepID=A0ABW3HLR3_9BACL